MTDEAKVRVSLDTRQARTELDNLTREAGRAADKTSGGIRRALKAGVSMVGLGAAVQTGISSVRAASASGFGDIAGEALHSIGANIAEAIFGDLDDEARGTKAAREEAMQTFGLAVGANKGKIPPGVDQWFAQVKTLRTEEEKGRGVLDRHFSDTKLAEKLLDRILKGIGELLMKAADHLAEKLTFGLHKAK